MTSLCIKCGADSRVTDSRPRPNGVMRRRRVCKECAHKWTTEEVTVDKRGNFLRDRAQAKRLRYASGIIDRFFKQFLSEVK
jgi:transcriptional regulator NrdR family protein